jgi:hypothetical protein
MQTNLKKPLVTWASILNLNWLIEFHNYIRGLFKEQLHDLEKHQTNDDIRNKQQKDFIYQYDSTLHINTFLMMFSYLEEWLYCCWKAYAPNVNLVDKKGSVGRFKNVVKQLGVDLSSKQWQILMDAEEIRNCVLHANGRISLLKDPQKVRGVADKKNSFLAIAKDHIVISSEYLQLLNENISQIMDIINESQI